MPYNSEEVKQKLLTVEKAFADKAHNEALAILKDIITKNPDIAIAYKQLGLILMQTETPEQALPYLQKAVSLLPTDVENWFSLGIYYRNQKNWVDAEKAFIKILDLSKEHANTLYELFKIYSAFNQTDKACSMAKKLFALDLNYGNTLWECAKLLKKHHKDIEAFTTYRQLVESNSKSIPVKAVKEWYPLMIQYRFVKEARHRLKILTTQNPSNSMLKNLYAASCIEDFDNTAALSIAEELYQISPEDIHTIFNLAIVYRREGNFEKVIFLLQKVIDKEPLHTETLLALSELSYFKTDTSFLDKINNALKHLDTYNQNERIALYYAAGKTYDYTGNYDKAFKYYEAAGHLQAGERGKHNASILEQHLYRSKKIMTKAFFDTHNSNIGYQSKKPIFIVGMPRSGTTLIEQVLSSMNGIYGAGELPYVMDILNEMEVDKTFKLDFGPRKSYFPATVPTFSDRGKVLVKLMESHAPDWAKHIIDKEPNNFIWLGFLHLILPEATFIHARRHPVETCLSAYRIRFASGQYWSCDLRTMGKHYRVYTELMEHWKSVLPKGRILEVKYEDMVTDLGNQSKRLAAHIGVEWQASCLDFHKTERTVNTASAAQVRKPIYKTSINRWQKYEPYLKPLLDEIGDLVKKYEKETIYLK